MPNSIYNLPDWGYHYTKRIRPKTKCRSVSGAAADTNIAVSGIVAAKDVILMAFNVTDDVHCTEMPVIAADGQIKFPTLVTTGKTIVVQWYAY